MECCVLKKLPQFVKHKKDTGCLVVLPEIRGGFAEKGYCGLRASRFRLEGRRFRLLYDLRPPSSRTTLFERPCERLENCRADVGPRPGDENRKKVRAFDAQATKINRPSEVRWQSSVIASK